MCAVAESPFLSELTRDTLTGGRYLYNDKDVAWPSEPQVWRSDCSHFVKSNVVDSEAAVSPPPSMNPPLRHHRTNVKEALLNQMKVEDTASSPPTSGSTVAPHVVDTGSKRQKKMDIRARRQSMDPSKRPGRKPMLANSINGSYGIPGRT